MADALPDTVDGLPNICGAEARIANSVAAAAERPVFLRDSGVDFARIRSAFAIALHMHQPLIPVGDDLRTAEIASNLKQMMERGNDEARGNADVFRWCYKRMGEFVPQLVEQGMQPRVMLDYSGTLLWGMHKMGFGDVFDALRTITCDPRYRSKVEWLGSGWGHPVAPSTPVQDYRLHLRAWQHYFAALFGIEALQRVRGFSPAEMALPNHPDVAYEFVRALRECGYRWVLVQEHTVERPNGSGPEHKHLPHRLVCQNSRGETAEIIAIIKTQGSDTKLVAQMQPCYEARSLSRWELAGRSVPPLVTQIADGENGGVMMNEFPPKYMQTVGECSGSDMPAMNVTEYLEHLFVTGARFSSSASGEGGLSREAWLSSVAEEDGAREDARPPLALVSPRTICTSAKSGVLAKGRDTVVRSNCFQLRPLMRTAVIGPEPTVDSRMRLLPKRTASHCCNSVMPGGIWGTSVSPSAR